jgi:hypothetical protein
MSDELYWTQRRRVQKHNAHIGRAVRMREYLNEMVASPSTTPETKQIARTILGVIPKLQNSLTTRVDPKEK